MNVVFSIVFLLIDQQAENLHISHLHIQVPCRKIYVQGLTSYIELVSHRCQYDIMWSVHYTRVVGSVLDADICHKIEYITKTVKWNYLPNFRDVAGITVHICHTSIHQHEVK